MFVKPIPPRHKVAELDSEVQVTLPSRKNVFRIGWYGLWLLLWGYITGGLLYIWGLFIVGLIGSVTGLLSEPPSDGESYAPLLMVIASLMPFVIVLLAMGSVAIFAFLWQINGSEIIEVKEQALVITKRVFRWKRPKLYEMASVKDIRLNTQGLSFFPPYRAVQELLGHNGLIAFDYGARTYRFGLDIDEAEAKQIISVLNQHMARQNSNP